MEQSEAPTRSSVYETADDDDGWGIMSGDESESESESEEQQADEYDDVRARAERLLRKVSIFNKGSKRTVKRGSIDAKNDGVAAAASSAAADEPADESEGRSQSDMSSRPEGLQTTHDNVSARAERLLRKVSVYYNQRPPEWADPDATASPGGGDAGRAMPSSAVTPSPVRGGEEGWKPEEEWLDPDAGEQKSWLAARMCC